MTARSGAGQPAQPPGLDAVLEPAPYEDPPRDS